MPAPSLVKLPLVMSAEMDTSTSAEPFPTEKIRVPLARSILPGNCPAGSRRRAFAAVALLRGGTRTFTLDLLIRAEGLDPHGRIVESRLMVKGIEEEGRCTTVGSAYRVRLS